MTLPEKIKQLLTEQPNLTGGQIIEKIGVDGGMVRVALWKMAKTGKVLREKQESRTTIKGPKAQYIYKLG
jgi:predicted transcriptional regulator